jgi:PAS domain S-box-containing protein
MNSNIEYSTCDVPQSVVSFSVIRYTDSGARKSFSALFDARDRGKYSLVSHSEQPLVLSERRRGDRRRTVDAARALDAVVQGARDMWLLVSERGTVLQANASAMEALGCSAEPACASSLAACFTYEADVQAVLSSARDAGGLCRVQASMRRRDGVVFPAEVSATRLRGASGPGGISVWVRDCSAEVQATAEQSRLTAALARGRTRLAAILEQVPFGVALVEPDLGIFVNSHGEALLGPGWLEGEPQPAFTGRVLRGDGSPMALEDSFTLRVLRTGESVSAVEVMLERRDGTRIPVLLSSGPIREDSGRIVGAVTVFQDLTERVRAERMSQANERLLSDVFDMVPVGLCLVDPDGRVIRTNAANVKIWGRQQMMRPAVDARAWWASSGTLLKPEDWASSWALYKRETLVGQRLRVETRAGEHKTIINSAMPLYDASRTFLGALIVNEDVTSLWQAEERLQAALKSRDDVLGIVAHDLRNPLGGVLLNIERLEMHPLCKAPGLQRIIASMARQAQRMDNLIQDLLDVARIQAGALTLRRERFDLASCIRQVVDTQRALASAAAMRIDVQVGEEAISVLADRDRLAQVLENLIGNAIKFSPGAERIVVGARVEAGEVIGFVKDFGKGVSPEDLPHLFERFWQAPAASKRGTGLGLAIVAGIIEAHGGRAWAESVVGEGTTVLFAIPLEGHGAAT